MSVFLDANVPLYAALPDSEPGRACRDILAAVIGRDLDARTSTGVVEEVLQVELRSTVARFEGLARATYAVLTPLLPVTDETIALALDLDLPSLGSNDRVHVATCRLHGIEAIVTADRGFDGIDGLRRIDPLDADAVAALVGREPGQPSGASS